MTNMHRALMHLLDAHGISWGWEDGRLIAENVAMVAGEPLYSEIDVTDWNVQELREWLGH